MVRSRSMLQRVAMQVTPLLTSKHWARLTQHCWWQCLTIYWHKLIWYETIKTRIATLTNSSEVVNGCLHHFIPFLNRIWNHVSDVKQMREWATPTVVRYSSAAICTNCGHNLICESRALPASLRVTTQVVYCKAQRTLNSIKLNTCWTLAQLRVK